jgi:hypothetical protein
VEGISMVERAAYHEAGHVAIWRRFKRQEFSQHGYVFMTKSGEGQTGIHQPDHVPQTCFPADQKCLLAIAGRAAEQIQYPKLLHEEVISLSILDGQEARELIRELCVSDLSEDGIVAQLAAFLEQARSILLEDWPAVRALAERRASLCDPIGVMGFDALRLMDEALAL